MKKIASRGLGYRLFSRWRMPGNICTVCLCVCFTFQIAMAQQGIISLAAKGLSLEIPGLPANRSEIIWDRLPLLKSERITVFEGKENASAFCHHASIFYYKDRFFAAWSNGNKDEDFSGQRVMYATSKDGHQWSKAINMTGSTPEMAYTPSGFWVHDGDLYALAGFQNSRASTLTSDTDELNIYRWNSGKSAFEYSAVIAKDFLGMEGPRQTPDGQWLMFGRPADKSLPHANRFAKGGKSAMDDWTIKPLPNDKVEHDIFWYTLPNGKLMSVEGTGNAPDRHLVSMYSSDNGNSWSDPVPSDFPDADSRINGLKLSNGIYVLLNNPSLSRYRIPLSISLSKDGEKFDHMANIRIEQTNKKYSGHAKAPGYQYMRAIEHAGKLWIIYSVNKENVEITTVSLDEIKRFYATDQIYENRKPAAEIIIDNNEKGFETNSPWPTDTVAGFFKGVRMGYHGHDYAYMKNSPASTASWAKWTPKIITPGVYAVYMKWPTRSFGSNGSMADVAPIEIRYPGGVHRSSVDESRYGGNWIYLGSFPMNVGNGSYVKIYAGKNVTTVADAVKFVKN